MALTGLAPQTAENWDRLWKGEKNWRPEDVYEIIDHLGRFYAAWATEEPDFPSSHWNRPDAHRRYVSRYLSHRINEVCGAWHDSLVANILTVAFDVEDGAVSAESVREWRRGGRSIA